MTTEDVFRRITEALAQAGIPYMLTGSFASSYHGSPRATQDIDLVIAPARDQLASLVKSLPSTEYYVDLNVAHEAYDNQASFNIIDLATGWKIDLIMRKSRAFSQEEFNRRVVIDVLGMQLYVASAEDIVLAKLEWAKLGQSERQVQDVVELLSIRWNSLDQEYLEKWVDTLGIRDEWIEAMKRANIADQEPKG